MLGDHALLSCSGSERWIHCPPSVRLSQAFPDEETKYAAEGTLAHTLGELKTLKKLGRISAVEFETRVHEVRSNELYTGREMERITDDYRDYILEAFAVAKSLDPKAAIYIEVTLDLDHIVPEGFGRGDICIVAKDYLHFIDLKYGKGVLVEAKENPQQMLYACGALRKFFTKTGDTVKVRLTIYQPRIKNIDTWDTDSKYLMSWAHDVAAPAALLAFDGAGEFKAGEHCHFCPANKNCRKHYEYVTEIAKHQFAPPETISLTEVAEILMRAKQLKSWLDAVSDWAIAGALKGELKIPGMKLVRGTARRNYVKGDGLERTLIDDLMFDESEVIDRSVIGITELSNLVGPKNMVLLEKFIVKPQGAPTLVPLSDKRPPIGSAEEAKDVFANIEIKG